MIKVGYCVAYDWALLQYSLPKIYKHADIICLSIDKNRRSWSGEPFSWDECGFRKMIEAIDKDDKIKVYEDDFYDSKQLPMQNEVAQRNKIAAFLGHGGWHIQLDADEYFIDFESFVNYLYDFKSNRLVNINCPMINLYKKLPSGMLWIKPSIFKQVEYFPIATKYPKYEYGRRNGYFNILTNFPILHQSWARQENEIWEKLNNWGHAKDFDVKKYFIKWKQASAENYKSYKNFHHLYPETWPQLELINNIQQINELLELDAKSFPLPITSLQLKKSNSIWYARAKSALKLLKGGNK